MLLRNDGAGQSHHQVSRPRVSAPVRCMPITDRLLSARPDLLVPLRAHQGRSDKRRRFSRAVVRGGSGKWLGWVEEPEWLLWSVQPRQPEVRCWKLSTAGSDRFCRQWLPWRQSLKTDPVPRPVVQRQLATGAVGGIDFRTTDGHRLFQHYRPKVDLVEQAARCVSGALPPSPGDLTADEQPIGWTLRTPGLRWEPRPRWHVQRSRSPRPSKHGSRCPTRS